MGGFRVPTSRSAAPGGQLRLLLLLGRRPAPARVRAGSEQWRREGRRQSPAAPSVPGKHASTQPTQALLGVRTMLTPAITLTRW
jgi:hypothetical protein